LGLFASWKPAVLRIVSTKHRSAITRLQNPIHYAYPCSSGETVGGDAIGEISDANSITLFSLLSVAITGLKSQDIWENLKVPVLDNLNHSSEADRWLPMDSQNTPKYSSLLGMPFNKLEGGGNSTFLMQSWYWALQDTKMAWTRYPSEIGFLNSSSPTFLSKFDMPSGYEYYSGTNTMWILGAPSNWDAQSKTSISLIFAQMNFAPDAYDGHDVTRLEAILSQQPVEVNVTCNPTSCAATAIRNSTFPANYEHQVDWIFLSQTMLPNLQKAFPLEHIGSPIPGIFENFLFYSSNTPSSYGRSANVFLYKIPVETLALRLSQVLNTYWVAHSFLSNVAGSFNISDPTLTFAKAILNSTVIVSNNEDFMHCDQNWHAILCLAILVLFCAAILSAVITLVRISPDATDFLSALTRSDGQTRLDSGSFLNADDRVKLLKNVRLRIGDASPEENAGMVVIGRSENADALKRGRLYR
jgi:hypothetical protein